MLSICIPTFNRQESLILLLESIYSNKYYQKSNFEICISDNCSKYNIKKIIKKYQDKLDIKLNIFDKNYGRVTNMLKAVSMASKKYVWLIGDDEIFLKDTLRTLQKILKNYDYIDFFYINFLFADKKINKKDLKFLNYRMFKKNFNLKKDFILSFEDLFNKKINPDIFGGMFQSIFKKKLWNNFFKISEITDGTKSIKEFSTLTNTFPHSYIFSIAFENPLSMVISKPVVMVSSGYREWAHLYPYVRSFRLIEIFEINYKKRNISIFKFISIKNFLLRYYFVDLIYLFFKEKNIFRRLEIKKEINKIVYPFPYIYLIYYLCIKFLKNFKI